MLLPLGEDLSPAENQKLLYDAWGHAGRWAEQSTNSSSMSVCTTQHLPLEGIETTVTTSIWSGRASKHTTKKMNLGETPPLNTFPGG